MINFKISDKEKTNESEISARIIVDGFNGSLKIYLNIDETENLVFFITRNGQIRMPNLSDNFIEKAKKARLEVDEDESGLCFIHAM